MPIYTLLYVKKSRREWFAVATECASHNRCEIGKSLSFVLDEPTLHTHRTLGVSCKNEGNLFIYTFRVWAPRADSVHLVGDFVGWEKGRPMTALLHGVWEYQFTTETSLEGTKYKYKLFSREKSFYFADPYAWQSESAVDGASVVYTEHRYHFQDAVWLTKRKQNKPQPFHVYEINATAWRTHNSRPANEAFAVLGYRELAECLTPYVKSLGYTHVALSDEMLDRLCLMAPPARHGGFEDFLYFVNKLHTNGVGVLYPFPHVNIHAEMPESVCSYHCPNLTAYLFLTLLHFAENCHVDGFFLKDAQDPTACRLSAFVTQEVKKRHPDLIFLYQGERFEKDTVFDWVSDNGKENELIRYLACDPFFRRYHHKSLAIGNTNLLCEPPNTNRTLMSGFFGSYEEKFATMRLYHTLQLFYPSALVSQMGNELAPFTPRKSERELEWFLLDFPMHRRYFDFVKSANSLYFENKALHAGESTILYENENDNTLVIQNRIGEEVFLGVFNFSARLLSDYCLPISTNCCEIFSTDSIDFGGSGQTNTRKNLAQANGIVLDIPPLSAVILKRLS